MSIKIPVQIEVSIIVISHLICIDFVSTVVRTGGLDDEQDRRGDIIALSQAHHSGGMDDL